MAKKNQAIELNIDWSLLPNIIPIIFPLAKNSLIGLGYQRNFEILCKRYGLDGNNIYTLQGIGSFLEITRERVRQLEQIAEDVIRNVLQGHERKINVPSGLITEVREFSIVVTGMGPLFTEDELIEKICNRYQYNPQKAEYPTIRLLLTVLGMERLPDKPPRPNAVIKSAWITNRNFNRQLFFEARRKVDEILMETIAPLQFFDLMVKVNKGRKNPFQQSTVKLTIKSMAYVELVNEDTYQVSFDSLKSLADKAYRILYEQNKSLKISELHREINHRLSIMESGSTVPMRSISQQLIGDPRFKTVGRAGWILSTWNDFTTAKTVDIIREYFFQKKAEANLSEIYNFVLSKRPGTKLNSVRSYLAQKEKFTRVSEECFVPAEWKLKENRPNRALRKTPKSTMRAMVQAAVQEYCNFRDFKWIKLSDLKGYVLKKCGCKGPTFYHYLSEMAEIIKENRPDGSYCRMLTAATDANILKAEENWTKIISAGETRAVEFKRAAKWNDYEKKPDGNMVQQVVIEVAGFMNSDINGKIFIGVDDKTNTILGIEEDIKIADKGKPNRDGYSLFLSNAILSKLGKDLGQLFETRFQVINGKEICCIDVSSAPRIVYYDGQLYLRGNTQTNLLNAAEAVEFAKRKGDR